MSNENTSEGFKFGLYDEEFFADPDDFDDEDLLAGQDDFGAVDDFEFDESFVWPKVEDYEIPPALGPRECLSRSEIFGLIDPTMMLGWYRKTGNPIFVWDSVGRYLERNEPLPPDIAACLQLMSKVFRSALEKKGLLAAYQKVVIKGLFHTTPDKLKSLFKQGYEFRRNWAIVVAVDDLKMRPVGSGRKLPQAEIYEIVAKEFAVNSEAVRKIYLKRTPKGQVFSIEPASPPARK